MGTTLKTEDFFAHLCACECIKNDWMSLNGEFGTFVQQKKSRLTSVCETTGLTNWLFIFLKKAISWQLSPCTRIFNKWIWSEFLHKNDKFCSKLGVHALHVKNGTMNIHKSMLYFCIAPVWNSIYTTHFKCINAFTLSVMVKCIALEVSVWRTLHAVKGTGTPHLWKWGWQPVVADTKLDKSYFS